MSQASLTLLIKNMRQFYLTFPNSYALRSELSWTHYRSLMRVENEKARNFYLEETVKSNVQGSLIDLKIGDLTHQDLGQMQMYVHYYEREMMNEGDNPPIGIVLCADKSDSIVKYTLPEDEKQIFASKYKLYLPSEEELLNELNKEYLTIESYADKEKAPGVLPQLLYQVTDGKSVIFSFGGVEEKEFVNRNLIQYEPGV